jgi:hypothetical protein
MGIPNWSVGQVLTASDVNNWFVPMAVFKPSSTSITSSTSLTADPHLTVSVAASCTYLADLVLLYKGPNGAGFFQWDFDVPASATFQYVQVYQNSSGNAAVQYGTAGTSSSWANTEGTGGTTNDAMRISGTLVVSTTAGTFDLTWAQHASNGTATTLLAGSSMTLQRVA